jgi:hypothetical protein
MIINPVLGIETVAALRRIMPPIVAYLAPWALTTATDVATIAIILAAIVAATIAAIITAIASSVTTIVRAAISSIVWVIVAAAIASIVPALPLLVISCRAAATLQSLGVEWALLARDVLAGA